MDEDKVVMEAASSNERVLVLTDEAIKLGSQAHRQHLRRDLTNEVNQTNGTVISKSLDVRTLWQQGE
jgi:hypothetical protein